MPSRYLTMRDGARLAIDVRLPNQRVDGERVPAILHQTRYFRSIDWRPLPRRLGIHRFVDVSAATRRAFLAAGYAWIDVDVRGSGASTGTRPCPWWEDEIRDGAEVVDWITAQPWSDGMVGATGVSYAGTTSEMLLVNRHPAVKAIVPRFSLYDVYTDVAFPGGIHLHWFTETWARFNALLDSNAYHRALALMARVNLAALRAADGDGELRGVPRLLARLDRPATQSVIAGLTRIANRGVSTTDDDPDRELLRAAVAEHAGNFDVHDGATQVVHRDDTGISGMHPEASIDVFSPHTYRDEIDASGAAIYSYSGWLDGGYQHAAIKRHLNLPRGRSKLILGPWDHGGRQNISPFEPGNRAAFDHDAEMIRFFDCHLRGADNGIMDEPPVRYFTMGEERWKTADAWPPPGVEPMTWHLGPDGALQREAPADPGADEYAVDDRAGTGTRSRWRSLLGLAAPLGYGDRAAADARLLCYTSAPLPDDLEVTGHPVVHLLIAAPGRDAGVFVYLEDVAPNGRVTYVTEGQLRALHRKLSPRSSPYQSPAPARTYLRADAAPLEPGEPAALVFDLLPTSYRFGRGHALRLAIAGTDRDHFARIPCDQFRILRGGAHGSRLELPVMRQP